MELPICDQAWVRKQKKVLRYDRSGMNFTNTNTILRFTGSAGKYRSSRPRARSTNNNSTRKKNTKHPGPDEEEVITWKDYHYKSLYNIARGLARVGREIHGCYFLDSKSQTYHYTLQVR